MSALVLTGALRVPPRTGGVPGCTCIFRGTSGDPRSRAGARATTFHRLNERLLMTASCESLGKAGATHTETFAAAVALVVYNEAIERLPKNRCLGPLDGSEFCAAPPPRSRAAVVPCFNPGIFD